VISEHVLEKQFGGLLAGNIRCRWDEMRHLG